MPWRQTFGQRLRHMSFEQAQASLQRIQLRVGFAEQPEVCRLTGLSREEVTPMVVQEVCEHLAARTRQGRAAQMRVFDPTEQAD